MSYVPGEKSSVQVVCTLMEELYQAVESQNKDRMQQLKQSLVDANGGIWDPERFFSVFLLNRELREEFQRTGVERVKKDVKKGLQAVTDFFKPTWKGGFSEVKDEEEVGGLERNYGKLNEYLLGGNLEIFSVLDKKINEYFEKGEAFKDELSDIKKEKDGAKFQKIYEKYKDEFEQAGLGDYFFEKFVIPRWEGVKRENPSPNQMTEKVLISSLYEKEIRNHDAKKSILAFSNIVKSHLEDLSKLGIVTKEKKNEQFSQKIQFKFPWSDSNLSESDRYSRAELFLASLEVNSASPIFQQTGFFAGLDLLATFSAEQLKSIKNLDVLKKIKNEMNPEEFMALLKDSFSYEIQIASKTGTLEAYERVYKKYNKVAVFFQVGPEFQDQCVISEWDAAFKNPKQNLVNVAAILNQNSVTDEHVKKLSDAYLEGSLKAEDLTGLLENLNGFSSIRLLFNSSQNPFHWCDQKYRRVRYKNSETGSESLEENLHSSLSENESLVDKFKSFLKNGLLDEEDSSAPVREESAVEREARIFSEEYEERQKLITAFSKSKIDFFQLEAWGSMKETTILDQHAASKIQFEKQNQILKNRSEISDQCSESILFSAIIDTLKLYPKGFSQSLGEKYWGPGRENISKDFSNLDTPQKMFNKIGEMESDFLSKTKYMLFTDKMHLKGLAERTKSLKEPLVKLEDDDLEANLSLIDEKKLANYFKVRFLLFSLTPEFLSKKENSDWAVKELVALLKADERLIDVFQQEVVNAIHEKTGDSADMAVALILKASESLSKGGDAFLERFKTLESGYSELKNSQGKDLKFLDVYRNMKKFSILAEDPEWQKTAVSKFFGSYRETKETINRLNHENKKFHDFEKLKKKHEELSASKKEVEQSLKEESSFLEKELKKPEWFQDEDAILQAKTKIEEMEKFIAEADIHLKAMERKIKSISPMYNAFKETLRQEQVLIEEREQSMAFMINLIKSRPDDLLEIVFYKDELAREIVEDFPGLRDALIKNLELDPQLRGKALKGFVEFYSEFKKLPSEETLKSEKDSKEKELAKLEEKQEISLVKKNSKSEVLMKSGEDQKASQLAIRTMDLVLEFKAENKGEKIPTKEELTNYLVKKHGASAEVKDSVEKMLTGVEDTLSRLNGWTGEQIQNELGKEKDHLANLQDEHQRIREALLSSEAEYSEIERQVASKKEEIVLVQKRSEAAAKNAVSVESVKSILEAELKLKPAREIAEFLLQIQDKGNFKEMEENVKKALENALKGPNGEIGMDVEWYINAVKFAKDRQEVMEKLDDENSVLNLPQMLEKIKTIFPAIEPSDKEKILEQVESRMLKFLDDSEGFTERLNEAGKPIMLADIYSQLNNWLEYLALFEGGKQDELRKACIDFIRNEILLNPDINPENKIEIMQKCKTDPRLADQSSVCIDFSKEPEIQLAVTCPERSSCEQKVALVAAYDKAFSDSKIKDNTQVIGRILSSMLIHQKIQSLRPDERGKKMVIFLESTDQLVKQEVSAKKDKNLFRRIFRFLGAFLRHLSLSDVQNMKKYQSETKAFKEVFSGVSENTLKVSFSDPTSSSTPRQHNAGG